MYTSVHPARTTRIKEPYHSETIWAKWTIDFGSMLCPRFWIFRQLRPWGTFAVAHYLIKMFTKITLTKWISAIPTTVSILRSKRKKQLFLSAVEKALCLIEVLKTDTDKFSEVHRMLKLRLGRSRKISCSEKKVLFQSEMICQRRRERLVSFWRLDRNAKS